MNPLIGNGMKILNVQYLDDMTLVKRTSSNYYREAPSCLTVEINSVPEYIETSAAALQLILTSTLHMSHQLSLAQQGQEERLRSN